MAKQYDLDKLIKRLKQAESMQILAGFINDPENAKKAIINEYGYIKQQASEEDASEMEQVLIIPARPFMENAFKQSNGDWTKKNKELINDIIDDKTTVKQAAGDLGRMMVKGIQNSIIAGEYVPNAASTLKRKQSTKPLVDTRQMFNAIKSKVEFNKV
jgi:hypothetical protein